MDWPGISDAELELLNQLWDRGPSTVRELLEREDGERAYTTVQTLLARLEEKRYVTVDRSALAHRFAAAVSRDQVVERRLTELRDKVCGGEALPLFVNLVRGQRFSAEDIERFKAILDDPDATDEEPK